MMPMLAGKLDLKRLRYPLLVQPKIDGIRAIIDMGHALSRSMKLIPNLFVQNYFMALHQKGLPIHGLDGELIVGNHTDKGSFQNTTSGIMSQDGSPDFTYHVFDIWGDPSESTAVRYERTQYAVNEILAAFGLEEHGRLKIVPSKYVETEQELLLRRVEFAEQGYEGLIARFYDAPYKYGRSTANEGRLLKWKEWVDEEGTVEGFEELMHNDNEAQIDALGYTKRSTHKANKRPGNMLGALVVRCARYNDTVRIGSGFDHALRHEIWQNKPQYLGKIVKFKHFPIGQKDLPRHPIFLAFRHPDDM